VIGYQVVEQARQAHEPGRPPAPHRAPAQAPRRPASPEQVPATRADADPATLLLLQRTAGNASVATLLAAREVQRPGAVQRADAATATAPPATQLDNEGNELATEGGRTYLIRLPPGITWHRGKPQALPPNPVATMAALKARVHAVAQEQLAYADGMKVGDAIADMKYWFAKVYHRVTINELAAVDAGVYEYPLMKLQEVIGFHATYKANIDAWRENNLARVEGNWRVAFAEASAAMGDLGPSWFVEMLVTQDITSHRSMEVLNSLLPSMQAHIRFDLPRAIASVFETYYQGIPGLSIADFHADFDRMGPIFEKSQADVTPEIDAFCGRDKRPDPGGWHWLQGLGFPFIFNIPMERMQAWEKAEAIVGGHLRGITTQPEMQRRLRAYMLAPHPFSGKDAFSVAGKGVDDYDWNTQP
jgi:hypothetical protein